MTRIFMIGWDGATFDLIKPWVRQGKLPNLARLLEEGVHGPLRSTTPPWTFPAWTSFMTGKNPGKHGIYDFFRPRPGTYALEFTQGGHRRGDTFWKLLSEAGRRVISISVPCTFPPEKLKNGLMISGFDFPGEGPGSYVDARGMHPPELHEELRRNVGRHPIDSAIIKEINQGRFDLVLERVLDTIRQKAATAKYLMTHKPWDCFMILFGESDGVGHQFWKYCDPDSPLFTDQPPGLQDSILRVYEELDRQVGEMRSLLPADGDTTILMMSDHGFGGVSDWIIYPNCWLQEKGFLRFKGGTNSGQSRLLNRLKLWAVAHLPAWLQRALYRFGGKLIGGIEARVRYGMIDWEQTQAYFDENPYFPVLRINLKGRQPKGIVEEGTAYRELRDRLIRELEAWRHPETGAAIVDKAFRGDDLYHGSCAGQAADIIPKWSLHQGYCYAFRVSSKSANRAWLEQVDPHQPEISRFYTGKSGTHRDDGIFLAWGPGIRAGFPVTGARIVDLAPTILHLLDVPVPDDMDGRVLRDLFTSMSARPVLEKVVAATDDMPDDTGYSPREAELMRERIAAMGYE